MKVSDLDLRLPVTVTRSDTLRDAAKHLIDDDIGALVVFEPRGLVGIFTERDLARAVADDVSLDYAEVGDYMTPSPMIVDDSAAIGDAIAKMNEASIRHLVVTDGADVIGVLSIRDLLLLFGTAWPEI